MNRFGGMRDSAFFRCDIRDLSSKLWGGESGNSNYQREWYFLFSWGWDSGFAKGTELDTGFQSLSLRASETLEFARLFFPRTLLSCHARKTERKRATSKIDKRKNCKLAETNLLCV